MDPLASAPGTDAVDVVALTRALVDMDSTTGREGEVGAWLESWLRAAGWRVVSQTVEGTRANVYADLGRDPLVVLTTHMDCVPPFVPSRLEEGRVYGRGACDAKGILAAQIAAATRLRGAGRDEVGLVFVVGEERGSDGAPVSAALARGSRYCIDGEPTDRRLARATRGALRVTLRATGRAAHSSFPELGDSAIEKLVDALVRLRGIALPAEPVLGTTHYAVGLVSGGLAPNVVPPEATAEVMFRTVGPGDAVVAALAPLSDLVAIERGLEVPVAHMHLVEGFDTAIFPFTTDVPWLAAWGTPLLFGPGSIHVAHTAGEYIEVAELEAAVDDYVTLVETLLCQPQEPDRADPDTADAGSPRST